jgi:hypothetical protein
MQALPIQLITQLASRHAIMLAMSAAMTLPLMPCAAMHPDPYFLKSGEYRVCTNRYNFLLESLHDLDQRFVHANSIAEVFNVYWRIAAAVAHVQELGQLLCSGAEGTQSMSSQQGCAAMGY